MNALCERHLRLMISITWTWKRDTWTKWNKNIESRRRQALSFIFRPRHKKYGMKVRESQAKRKCKRPRRWICILSSSYFYLNRIFYRDEARDARWLDFSRRDRTKMARTTRSECECSECTYRTCLQPNWVKSMFSATKQLQNQPVPWCNPMPFFSNCGNLRQKLSRDLNTLTEPSQEPVTCTLTR